MSELSAPTAAMNVPGFTRSGVRKALRADVQVTMMSLSRVTDRSAVARISSFSADDISRARRSAASVLVSQTLTRSSRAAAAIAMSWMRPCTPAPQMVAIRESVPRQMARGERCGGSRAVDRHLDRVHHRKRPAILAVGEIDHALHGRQPVGRRIAGKVAIDLDGGHGALTQQSGALGMERPVGNMQSGRRRRHRLALGRRDERRLDCHHIVLVRHQPGDVGARQDEQPRIAHGVATS